MISMRELFPACVAVLWRELRPLHYKHLTQLAANFINREIDSEELVENAENVREKLLQSRRLGTFYSFKAGGSLGGIRDWFSTSKRWLFNPESYHTTIHGSAEISIRAGAIALMREVHMKTKIERMYGTWERNEGLSRGLNIEGHVTHFFQSQWPEFYQPPDNEKRFTQVCDHDFRLIVGGNNWKIDVYGPRKDGSFGPPRGGGKMHADQYIVASNAGENFIIHGFLSKMPTTDFSPESTKPISRLIVFLNCYKFGIDWKMMKFYSAKSTV